MIFAKLDILFRSLLYSKFKPSLVDYWLKPIYKCSICMSSVWGIPVFIIFVPLPIYFLPVYVISMAGFQYIVSQIVSKQIEIVG